MFGTQAKARWHLERAEYWQNQVDGFEKSALKRAAGQEEGRMQRKDGSRIDLDYMAGTLLKDDFRYHAAVANRNAHQRQAEIYSLAHMAGILDTPWHRGPDGLTQPQALTQAPG